MGMLIAQRYFLPVFMNKPADEAVIADSEVKVLAKLQEFEKIVAKRGFAVGKDFSVVDVGYGVWFRQLQLGGYEIDRASFPKTVAYLERVYAVPGFQETIKWENEDEMIKDVKEKLTSSFAKPMIE